MTQTVFIQGFCIDLLRLLGEKINFTFDVHLSQDGRFGTFVKVSLACLHKIVLYVSTHKSNSSFTALHFRRIKLRYTVHKLNSFCSCYIFAIKIVQPFSMR